MKYITFFLLLLIGFLCYGQKQESPVIKEIESGEIAKIYSDGKLESFVVKMYAVNYENELTFKKLKDAVIINDAQNEDAVIKIYFKGNREIRELLYQGKMISSVEEINFDLNNLPNNTKISTRLVNNKLESYTSKVNVEHLENADLDKSLKLFSRLDYKRNSANLDSILNAIADFFSEEDALLKIYSGEYAERSTPTMTAYIQTNEFGKIETGIIWTSKDLQKGKYEIYSKGKITKTEFQSIATFQKTLLSYLEKTMNE